MEVEGSKILRPKTWVVEGEYPDGVTFEIRQDLGIVVIFGIPTQSGTFPIVVRAWELANMMGDPGTPLAFDIIVEALGPVITSQLSDQSVVWGESLNLSVSVDMPAGITYQWQSILSGETEYIDLEGETANTLSIDSMTSVNEGMYRVIATGPEGSTTSTSATVAVTPIPPFFAQEPSDQSVVWGEGLNLSATIGNPEGISYRWQRMLSDETEYVDLNGETESTLSIDNMTSMDEGMYRVIATSSEGSTPSASASVSVTPIAPFFVQQPLDESAVLGESLNLSVTVGNPEGISYQWERLLTGESGYKNIEGATENVLLMENLTDADEGLYRVVATNPEGSTTSPSATIVVTPIPPSFSSHPFNQTVDWGGTLSLSATVEIAEGTTYHWQRILSGEIEYQDLGGEMGNALSINNLTSADEGLYRVIATNSDTSATSEAAIVSVSSSPLQLWKETLFDDPFSIEADFNSDPDFDTLVNATEFAFGLDPKIPEKNPFVQISQENIDGTDYAVFTYPSLKAGAESEVSLENNTTLDDAAWMTLANGENGSIIESTIENYIVKIPLSLSGFHRMRIVSD